MKKSRLKKYSIYDRYTTIVLPVMLGLFCALSVGLSAFFIKRFLHLVNIRTPDHRPVHNCCDSRFLYCLFNAASFLEAYGNRLFDTNIDMSLCTFLDNFGLLAVFGKDIYHVGLFLIEHFGVVVIVVVAVV